METAQIAAIIITAIGGPALLLSGGRSFWKWWTGRSGRERTRNKGLAADIDREATLRRKAQEYASELRSQLIEAGITPRAWPDGLSRSTPKQKESP